MVQEPIAPGHVLAARYRLEAILGEGGFGTVWRAEHLVLEAPVAIKLIDPDIAHDEHAVERFMREAKAAASLRSPHVVQILDYGIHEDHPFIAMELLEGETVQQRIKRLGKIPASDAIRILTHIARAITRAHEAGVVHRDLKPENVFLVPNDDEEIAKVLDFGVAKIDPAKLGMQSSSTRTGSLLGTPYYMSPEQVLGNKEVDWRSDLWSIAVIAFEMLTGRRPFVSDGLGDLVLQITVRPLPVPSQFAPVPAGFDDWWARAMAREPSERFDSARALVDTLREALDVNAEEEGALVTVPSPREEKSLSASDRATSGQDSSLSPTAATVRASSSESLGDAVPAVTVDERSGSSARAKIRRDVNEEEEHEGNDLGTDRFDEPDSDDDPDLDDSSLDDPDLDDPDLDDPSLDDPDLDDDSSLDDPDLDDDPNPDTEAVTSSRGRSGGATRSSRESLLSAPPTQSRTLAIGVAVGALLLGAGGTIVGVQYLDSQQTSATPPHERGSSVVSKERKPDSSRRTVIRRSPARPPGVVHLPSGTAGSAPISPSASSTREGIVRPPDEWRPREVNGKVIKPDWARPDEPEPPPAPRPQPFDNPYD